MAKTTRRFREPCLGLQDPPLGEARGIAAGDDDVVEDADVNQGQGLFDTLRNELIGLTRLRDAARMIVD